MKKELMEKVYCSDCGKPMKEVKRKPQYRVDNGKLMGYQITLRCKRFPLIKCYRVISFEEASEGSKK